MINKRFYCCCRRESCRVCLMRCAAQGAFPGSLFRDLKLTRVLPESYSSSACSNRSSGTKVWHTGDALLTLREEWSDFGGSFWDPEVLGPDQPPKRYNTRDQTSSRKANSAKSRDKLVQVCKLVWVRSVRKGEVVRRWWMRDEGWLVFVHPIRLTMHVIEICPPATPL